jgi:hypothetical protein
VKNNPAPLGPKGILPQNILSTLLLSISKKLVKGSFA